MAGDVTSVKYLFQDIEENINKKNGEDFEIWHVGFLTFLCSESEDLKDNQFGINVYKFTEARGYNVAPDYSENHYASYGFTPAIKLKFKKIGS
jgi:hypothetical protein